jgi:hypothetical protein
VDEVKQKRAQNLRAAHALVKRNCLLRTAAWRHLRRDRADNCCEAAMLMRAAAQCSERTGA